MNLNSICKLKYKNLFSSFKGGIHPPDFKEITKSKNIINLPAPDILTFPLLQHTGAPASPCIAVGDSVLMGQKIAEASGNISANVHSSVSGKVLDIKPVLHYTGQLVESIVIENDRLDTPIVDLKKFDYNNLLPEDIINIVKEAGIVGMGGAAFPTHIKLSPPQDKKIDSLIINGAECEPYLTADYRLMMEYPQDIILGLKILMKIFSLKSSYIAVELNKPEAISLLNECLKDENDTEIKIVPLAAKYPQGSEKQLIYSVVKKRVPKGKLPMDVGAVVINIATCAEIARAVRDGMPLIKRIVTVAGDCIANPSNFYVRIGTPVSYLLEKCGGFTKDAEKIIMGGPMMGTALSSVDVAVVKGTSGILALSEDFSDILYTDETCLRCGKCVNVCPMNLLPNVLKKNANADNFEMLEKLNINECIECGSCSYICPAHQHPVQSIRTGKIKMKNKAQKGE